MKRSLSVRSLLAGVLVLAACSKQGAGEADIAEVAPETVPVLAMVELPSGLSLGSAAQVLDAVQPGASVQATAAIPIMLTSMAEVGSLNGADLAKPIRALVLDPKQHPRPVLLLVSVRDAEQLGQAVGAERLLVRKDLALIGAPEAAKVAHDYAFGTLARRQAPDSPRATVYAQPLLASFRADIDVLKTQMGAMMAMAGAGSDAMTKMLTLYIDSLLAVAEQSERVEMRFASQDALSGVELTVHARPGTTLAGFNQAQAPGDLGLIEMLPADVEQGAPILVMAGSVAMGPAREAHAHMGDSILATLSGPEAGEELRGWMGPFMDLFTGRFAAVVTGMSITPQMIQLIETSDSAQAASLSRQLMEKFAARRAPLEIAGVKQTIAFTPEAFAHDGVTVMMQQTTTELPESPDAEMPSSIDSKGYFAGVDGFLGMAMGEEQDMRRLIDAVRSKAPRLSVDGALAGAVAATRTRKDSAMMFMNLGALLGGAEGAPQAVIMALGFEDARMRLFVAAGR